MTSPAPSPGDPSPRASVAVIVPSVNVVLEDDLRRFLPGTVARRVTHWETGKEHRPVADLLEAAAPAEALLGKPVITSNQALAWAIARRLGQRWRPPDGGRLFDHGLDRRG